MTMTNIMEILDSNDARWRLLLEEPKEDGHPIAVVLQCRYSPVVDGWVHVKHVTSNPDDVGISYRKNNVTMLDGKKARSLLLSLMADHGATPKPRDIHEGLQMLSTMPGVDSRPVLDEPEVDGHVKMNLLDYLLGVEGTAANATPGLWYAADGQGKSLGSILEAVCTGAPSDPVCESMAAEDLRHVLAAQPLAVGAMVRKLREAFFLLQDLSKAALAARGEIDHLVAPQHRPDEYARRIDMFDRWMAYLGQRCAVFPTIQVPAFEGVR